MEIYKRKGSTLWWYDFAVRGERFRGSTGETKRSVAAEVAAKLLSEIAEGKRQTTRKPQTLFDFSTRFLAFVDNAKLEDKSKDYLRNGWRLLAETGIAQTRMNMIGTEQINELQFPGGPYNVNCALKTLRRMLNLSKEWGLLTKIPTIKLQKEPGRSVRLDEEAEIKLRPHSSPLLRDIVVLLRDTGLRVKRELFRIRIEHLDWKYRVIMIPDSKTPDGKRMVPMSDRVFDLLFVRCGDRKEGWLFPANSKSGHIRTIDKQFHAARKAAGLSPDVKLQCCRHDWSTEMVRKTGNLPLVMKILGQTSLTAAMKYQIPEIENLRAALNDTRPAQSETIIN